jgi:capsular polysaccharide biosynthesis protein
VPRGRVTSAREWSRIHPEATLVELTAGSPAPATPARTLGEPHPLFKDAAPRTPPPAWVLTVPGARLATEAGLVVTPDGDVLAETTWDEAQLEGAIARARRLPRPARVPMTAASLISLWSANFHHWLLDSLPRLGVLERAGLSDLPLIVPKRLRRFQHESLDLLGVAASRLVPYRGGHVAPDVVVWPSPAAHIGNPTPDVVAWVRERLGPPEGREPTRRLYVSRAHVQAGALRRRVENEDALVALLRARGFEVVQPELMSLAEQAALFAEAAVVVGAHGAAHTSTLFSTRLALVELFEPSFFNGCNLMLARAAGHDYWYAVGATSGPGDVIAPLELVEATVDKAIAAQRRG